MYDSGKIIAGIIIFIGLFTAPLWFNFGGDDVNMPQLALPTGDDQQECVNDAKYMRTNHMDLLNEWRDEVVRTGERYYKSPSGRKFEMSMSKTCTGCHSNKEEFCDRCHNYLAVTPYCWDCHVEPQLMVKK